MLVPAVSAAVTVAVTQVSQLPVPMKTTLLATIMGHTELHSGSIVFRGRDIGALATYQRAALGLALVPQEREIFRSLTVEENLIVAERAGRWTLGGVYDFFPSLAARRHSRGEPKAARHNDRG